MATNDETRWARLTIDVEPELRRKIEIAAAEQALTVRDYVVAILHRALATEEQGELRAGATAWERLSVRSFARDWESDEDRVYDDPS